MQCDCARLTVYFEDPFWVGVYEREERGRLTACKITFGAEPRDQEIYELLLSGRHRLEFGAGVEAEGLGVRSLNPKRAQRAAAETLSSRGVGTKAQQALQLQREQNKQEKRQRRRTRDEETQRRQFLLRQEKKREKHRGH